MSISEATIDEMERDQAFGTLANAARTLVRDLAETIEEWQEASGLTVGGDPGGVEPRHVKWAHRHIAQLLREARRVLGDVESAGAVALLREIEQFFDGERGPKPAEVRLRELEEFIAARTAIGHAARAIGALASAVKSGEPFTAELQAEMDAAGAAMERAT